MTKSFDPFRFLLIAVSGWMNKQQLQLIDYLGEENLVVREQLGQKRLRFNELLVDSRAGIDLYGQSLPDPLWWRGESPKARTTILHSESWDCKRFSWDPTTNVGSRPRRCCGGYPAKDRSNEKRNGGLSIGP